jgi:tetratricopeptide (TPR) repeat protein
MYARGMGALALGDYWEALKIAPEYVEARFMLGRCLEDGWGNRRDAIEAFEEVLRLYPEHQEARLHLERCLASVKTPHDLDSYDREVGERMHQIILDLCDTMQGEAGRRTPAPPEAAENAEARRQRQLKNFIEMTVGSVLLGTAADRKEDEKLLLEALGSCNELLALAPEDLFAVANKGVIFSQLGRDQEALDCLDRALEMDPKLAHAWHNKAILLRKAGRVAEALRCWDEALRLDPNLVWASYYKAICLWEQARQVSDLGPVLDCLNRAVTCDPRFAEAWTVKGRLLDQMGQPAEAVVALQRAVEVMPARPDAWFELGLAMMKLERPLDAAQAFQRVVEIAPDTPGALQNLGAALSAAGRVEDGLASFESALGRDPGNQYVRAMRDQAAALLAGGRSAVTGVPDDHARAYEEARGRRESVAALLHAERWVAAEPRSAGAWYGLASCLVDFNLDREAEPVYRTALGLDPGHADAWYDLGASLLRCNQYTLAHDCFVRAQQLDPQASDAWSMDGCALIGLKAWGEAQGCFEKALELDPNNEPARANLNSLRQYLRKPGG